MSKNTLTSIAALAALAALIFMVRILSPETYAEWKELTFHEPAHFLFEWQNEVLVAVIVIPLWKRAKAKAVSEAIARHDAKFHPYSHRVDNEAEGVV